MTYKLPQDQNESHGLFILLNPNNSYSKRFLRKCDSDEKMQWID